MTKQHETLLPPTDEQYVFFDFRPNTENPITPESFRELGVVIRDIEHQLGLERNHHFSVVSRGQQAGDDVFLHSYEGPDELKVLGVDTYIEGKLTNIIIRNDAGTVANPGQIAAGATISSGYEVVIDRQNNLSNGNLIDLVENIRMRAEEFPFTKEPIIRV